MKLETWFCKPYLIRRNLTRFWPAWAGFSLLLLIWELAFRDGVILAQSGLWQPMMVLTSLCGLVAAMLAFGYLFVPRYVNTMHSLPVGREGLFLTGVLSGLSLMVLSLLLAGVAALLRFHDWYSVLCWLGKVLMCYFYGFSLGALSAVLAGTRLGAVTIWGLLAFGPCILEFLLKDAACSVLWGVERSGLVLEILSPLIYSPGGAAYMAWVDVACFGLLILALFLNRVRKTEATGDFAAFFWLNPVIKLILTLMGGILLGTLLASVMGIRQDGSETFLRTLMWLLPGLLIAGITAEMLVSRTVRVFSAKYLLRYGLYMTAAFSVMLLLSLDVFGVVSCVPATEEIDGVRCSLWPNSYGYYEECMTVSDENVLQTVTSLHREILDHRDELSSGDGVVEKISIIYTLKDSSVLTRTYQVHNLEFSDSVQQLAQTVSMFPQAQLQSMLDQEITLEALQEKVSCLSFSKKVVIGSELDSLLEALWQDLQEGHVYYGTRPGETSQSLKLTVEIDQPGEHIRELRFCTLEITETAQHLWPLLEKVGEN